MPVGRFVLDVHGEARTIWPASDALCAALQIINHLQDCAADYRMLDRVYIPLDALATSRVGVETLADKEARPALKDCLHALAARTAGLLRQSRGLEASVRDRRLALEISVIRSLATRLLTILQFRDPLSEPTHLTKIEVLTTATNGGARGLLRRLLRTATPTHRYQTL
jgi:phytoene/squalene synthetase